jgi:hypothetical protein
MDNTIRRIKAQPFHSFLLDRTPRRAGEETI